MIRTPVFRVSSLPPVIKFLRWGTKAYIKSASNIKIRYLSYENKAKLGYQLFYGFPFSGIMEQVGVGFSGQLFYLG